MTDVDFCVIGAGFAGLTAALRLKQAGHSVAVLEARDRVGGRTFTVPCDDGSWIDRGGAWVGPTQDRIYALMNEFGVQTFKQYTDGDAMMVVDGKQHRYSGMVPWTMSLWASLSLGAAMFELGQMCKSVPLEAPWEAKKAQKWDRMTLAQWLEKNVKSAAAHALLDTAVSGCYTSAASEVSMLFMLYQMGSAGGPTFVLGGKDGSQDARVIGGMGAIYQPMADQLGDAIQLSQPVRYITQDADGVTVRSEHGSVRALRAIVAVPLAIASQIIYEPMLPTDRAFLHQRMPSGAVVKISIVYDEPFWRADGLCGQSAAPGSLATVTIDACTDTGTPGILCVVIEGPVARQYERLDSHERRQGVLDALVERFGAKAGKPVDYHEQNWTREPFSGGGMLSHAPPGVLTEFGHALREPCGRIHWAGTETSTKMCGWIDGAIRSGERAADEVMTRTHTVRAGTG
ncbi:MAG: flavin monoamine oxidase family protein [Mycobacterium sp.]|uniref:flavin monoamine oxidase family protein n=1 Tax=Mycobacterium sp. TaxID=1785 RepID=UPI001ED1032B|nr:flavin monoamine oxidase family protein [Mycobacterium sp.]MBW0016641.1 flavin monoamine oxidase family protein [Mycobacterium sp.]